LGRLWIASLEGGLGRIDDPGTVSPKVRVLTTSQDLSSNEIWCVVEDNLGRIYAGNVRGVDRVDPNTGDILHYTEADGLVRGDIRSALRDRTGGLWFLSNRGASRFRPARDLVLPAAITRITGLQIAGNAWPISEVGEVDLGPLQLSSRQNSLTIEFGAIDFSTPSRFLYQYRLEGAPGDWSSPTADPGVTFANLSPGRYRFLVRSASARDPRSSEAAVQFTILPPVWRRWWFQGLIAILAAAIVYTLHRIQLKRKLALERVRSNIAMDLHDDLGASLARMAVIGEVMKAKVSQNDLESQLMLSDIAETSRRLVDGMSDTVWSIEPRHDQAGDTIYRLREFASTILEAKGIRWQLDAAPDVASIKLSTDQRRHLYLLCKEAIHNVARHSQARTAFVRLGIGRGIFQAEIEDDGHGLPVEGGRGLGMRSMCTRAAALGGTLDISTLPAQGTRVTLRFPLRRTKA
jgi:two-component sensor histidine kinase